jgi:signal transduction histidine kinase
MADQNKSLMGQIVRYFLLLSLVTVGAISGVAYLQSRHAIKQALFDRLTLTATLKEDELNRWIEDQREEMLAIVNLPEVQSSIAALGHDRSDEAALDSSEQYLRSLMGAIVDRHSSLTEILVLSPGGQVLLSTRPASEGNFEALVQYSYVPVDDTVTFTPNFYLSPNTQESRMSFAIPLQGRDGRSIGLLAMHLNLERIDEIIRKRTGLGETGETYLVGNQGSSLASYSFFLSEHDTSDLTQELHSEGIDLAMQGISGEGIYRNYRGELVVGVYRWLENRDLALIAEISCWEAFAPARKLAQTIVLTGASLVGLLEIGVYWGARRISRPILAISDAAERVAEGDFQARAPVLANNEIGLLARVFNQMTEQLRRLYTNLEAEVEERTSALKHANEDLAHAKEVAEVANRAKSQFLANISHELRTPLNAILGFSQLLIRDPAAQPSQRQHLEIINRSGEHLLALINDVLSMSKIEAGLVALNSTCFDLFTLLASLEHMLWGKADAKGLQLRFERSPDLPQYIHADEGKLRQVLINLLSNAIKFTSMGEVVLRAKPLASAPAPATRSTIGSESSIPERAIAPEASRWLAFEVCDTGPGIARQDLPNLFQPFVQTAAGHQSHEGTGLGLAISRQFVELMGGHIDVKSTLGKGATFTFTIQAQPASPKDLAPEPPPRRVIGLATGQPTYRILVVEDRWENRHLLVNLLELVGFEVREARDGREAIALWQSWQPHLIWMDMRMPVMDGYEATRQIRAMEESETFKIRKSGTRSQEPEARSQKRSAECGVRSAEVKNGPVSPRNQPNSPTPQLSTPPTPLSPPPPTIIIALTASAFEESRSEVLQAGCDDFVRKPFQEPIIFNMMAKHLPLRYVYEDIPSLEAQTDSRRLHPGLPSSPRQAEALSPASLASSLKTMPLVWLSEVQNAAIQADGDWLRQLIAEIPQQEYSLTTQLSTLTEKFEFDSILELLKLSAT